MWTWSSLVLASSTPCAVILRDQTCPMQAPSCKAGIPDAMDCSALRSKKTFRSQTIQSDKVRYKTHNHGSRRTWSSLVLPSDAPCAVDLGNQPQPGLILARTTPCAVALSHQTCPMHQRVRRLWSLESWVPLTPICDKHAVSTQKFMFTQEHPVWSFLFITPNLTSALYPSYHFSIIHPFMRPFMHEHICIHTVKKLRYIDK